MKISILIISFLISFSAFGVTIEFPEEELARESVLPVFDNTVAVKSRLVPTAKRIELGIGLGSALNEPFFNSNRFGGHLAYHINETHGILLNGMFYQSGLGDNGKSLAGTDFNEADPSGGNQNETYVRLEYAPQPKYHFFANYQITPYYGKISIFKDWVMNLSLYGLMGLGVVDVGGETTPAFQLGMGQKFYFSKRWGVRADLSLMAYEGVNFFQGAGGAQTPLQDEIDDANDFVATNKSVSEFERQMNYDLNFAITLIILL